MKTRSRIGFPAVSAVLLVAAQAAAALAVPSDGAGDPVHGRAPKTLSRWPDPVVLDCGMLASFQGRKIEFVRLFAAEAGRLRPIPFQIDERDPVGRRIYTAGEQANPQDANGVVDAGEELVFMARDTGDRVSEGDLPPGVEAWEELELEDPLTGGKGWAYLLYAEAHPLAGSGENYVEYVPATQCPGEGDCQVIRSRYMVDHYYPLRPYFDTSRYPNNGFAHRHLSTPLEAGGTGEDYVDRFKGRLTMAFLFGALKFRIHENSINAYEWAYKDGPVRLIRKVQIFITLPLGIKAPGFAVDLIWYDSIVNVPTVIDLPFNPGYLYTYMQLKIGEDHSVRSIGMRMYTSNNLQGVVVDGRPSPEETRTWDTGRDQWRLMTGPQGTVMTRSFWDERYLAQMKWVRVDYEDDMRKIDPPEDEPGLIGMISQTNRVEGIRKDRYYTYLEWYWPPSFLFTGPGHTYRTGDEKPYRDVTDAPIRIRAGNQRTENRYFGEMPAYENVEEASEEAAGDAEAPERQKPPSAAADPEA